MPQLGGNEIAERVRLVQRLKHTPILMVTAEPHARCGSVLAGVGAPDGLLAKPFGKTELLAAIATVLNRAKSREPMSPRATLPLLTAKR
jgi:DNA-binding response OmpR family regulator